MKKAILLFLFFVFRFSYGQNEKNIDSLKKVISSKISKDEKAVAYHTLLQITLNTDFEISKKYIKELYALNNDNSCPKCEVLGDLNQGYFYYLNNENKNSILFYEKSAKKALKIKDFENYEAAKMQLIQTFLNTSDIVNGEKELNDLLDFKKVNNLKKNTEYVYYLLGQLNIIKSFNNTAIEYFLLAEKKMIENKSKDLAFKITNNTMICTMYANLKSFDKAREYNNKALIIANETKDVYEITKVNLYRGFLETSAKNYAIAQKHLQKAYDFYKENGNKMYESSSAQFLGKVYYQLKDYPKSLTYSNIAIDFFSKNNQNSDYARAIVNRAKVMINNNNLESARQDINIAKSLIKPDSKDYIEVLDAEIDYFKKTNNINDAIKFIDLRDSLVQVKESKSNKNSLNEVEAKYQTKQKEQQIKLLSAQNELAAKQKYIYIALLGLLAIIGGSLFYGYRNKIKTAQKLNELNELKSRFFANISHEFRTPLTLIKSPVQSLQSEITNESQKSKLDLIDKNSNRMLDLVDQLLELSKLDSGKLQLILKEGNIATFLNSLVDSFTFQAKENKLSFTSTIEKNTENHHFDKDVIEKIVTNLLSNAIKYTDENEKVSFDSKIENNQLQLVVSNSGSEIKKEDLPKLFERFYQKKENHQGVGIGLALVKELVELYKGKIETNVENGILSFAVSLPLEKANENAIVVTKEVPKAIISEENKNENELPILLIVDDNQDVRMVLKDIFKSNYQILEAEDGEQALKIAKKEIPDCIISDVMMPKMDGFEFTKQIKNNELTSFIPVILLTARTTDEAHLEGLKSTADAYLTKPFNNEIVKETVNQLIAERKKLHQRYSQELVLRPVDIVINSVDEKFIEKLQVILDKELSNSEFSSEDFAAAVGMSRMQLHRKLKSLLGVSSTEFLRNERLKVATELLKKGNGNISDVAYAVGFNDVSYFSKCFKEVHGCSPTEYIEK
ncbi:response regulator [Flavobacterium sp.]|uniref:response regulator n=1 Tax=Flavobacterium sp. TaxID=239 RepID=UPI0026350FAB|nr:response regulator [Flavobacterium sp.]